MSIPLKDRARKRLYLLLDPPDQLQSGQKSRVLGPFRIVDFSPGGITVCRSFIRPRRIARVNQAGRYVLKDGSE